MTDDEKIGQLTLIENQSIDPGTAAALVLGGVLSGGDGNPTPNDAGAWYAMVDGYQRAALGTRLGIPILYGVDAVHGQSHVVGATIFPHQVGLGATGDASLVEAVGRATAVETSATGIRWTFAPVVAVPQDVRWGRTYEGFGADPALVSELGAALIRGLQGGDLTRQDAIAATAKHFAGDGGTAWGTSTTSGYQIDQGVTPVDGATLDAVHIAPYRAAIDAGARIVMASFSSTTAGKVHGDRHLLTDVLKGDLGFTGFVVSDWGGVDQVVPGDYDAALAQSIGAGIDMVMVPSDAVGFQESMRRGLASGRDLARPPRRRGASGPAREDGDGPVRDADAPGRPIRRRRPGAPRPRRAGSIRVGRPAASIRRCPAAPGGRPDPARRDRRGRHRHPARRLVDHVAGRARRGHARDDAPRRPRRPAGRPAVVRCGRGVRRRRPCTGRHRGRRGAAVRGGPRRQCDARAPRRPAGRHRPGPPARGSPRRRGLQRPADAPRSAGPGRRGRRGLAPRDRGAGDRRGAARRPDVHGHDAIRVGRSRPTMPRDRAGRRATGSYSRWATAWPRTGAPSDRRPARRADAAHPSAADAGTGLRFRAPVLPGTRAVVHSRPHGDDREE